MCRLTAYFGPPILVDDLLYRSERSVIRQSFDARERLGGSGGEVYEVGNLNADGFGLGWYRNEAAPNPRANSPTTPTPNSFTTSDSKEDASKVHEPCVFKDTGPAWLNRNLRNLARMIESRLVFAHVRAAGPGMSVCECSCHPFVYGRYMFMHNGSIGGFGQMRRRLMSRLSDDAYDFAIENSCSDSAVAFALFISKLEDPFQQLSPNELRRSMIQLVETICGEAEAADVKQISLLNFVLADGVNVAATRYVHKPSQHEKPTKAATLYFASGSKFEAESTKNGRKLERRLSQEGDCDAETFRMVRQDRRDKVVIITSEPLTNSRADWVPVPTNHILLITRDPQILLSPVVVNVESAPRLVRQVSSEFKQSVERNLAQGVAQRSHSRDNTEGGRGEEHGIRPFFILSSGNDSAALSMAQCNGYLYSTGTGNIYTWDVNAWQCCAVTEVKTSRILALCADEKKHLLFSSCSDNRVHVWTTEFMQKERRLHCVQHIEFPSIGHILDLCIIEDRLFTGSQDAMLRCVDNIYAMPAMNPTTPGLALTSTSSLGISETPEEASQVEQSILHCQVSEISPLNTIDPITTPPKRLISHFGYVYAVERAGKYIASAGGDGEIKLWSAQTLTLAATLRGHQQAVLALVACEASDTLYSGSIDGTVRVWDLEMLACRRTLMCRDDVLSLALVTLPGPSLNKVLLSGTGAGKIIVWSCARFERLQLLSSSTNGPVCSIAVLGDSAICAGTTCGTIVAWRLSSIVAELNSRSEGKRSSATELVSTEKAELLQVLREFVSIPSVSHEISTREDCWVAGRYISSVLEQFGGKVTVRTANAGLGQGLPVIIGELSCAGAEESVVIYGHYDVVSAERSAWSTDPWKMQCIDGYLYGRGVTDDKGPIVAALFATKDLYEQGRLRKNVIFLLEGEEESGVGIHARGFCQVIQDNRDLFANVAAIVISNNYWIDDHRPCLTYGMRGVIDASVSVVGSANGTLHAGVDGGPVYEPAEDLTSLLHALTTKFDQVVAPGVRQSTEEEQRRLDEADLNVESYAKKLGVERLKCATGRSILEARWSKPSVSISSLSTTNATGTFRKIPGKAEAKISFHFVPDQSATKQQEMLEAFLHNEFAKMKSGNQLRLRICQTSDWWLGRLENRVYNVAASAIEKVWGTTPVYVREGGSYGGITSFLETTLNAPAIHLPLGQSSDNAHLANERIRLHSLIKGKDVIEHFLTEL